MKDEKIRIYDYVELDMNEGEIKAYARGITKGIEESRIYYAIRMYRMRINSKVIANILGIPVAEVQEIINEHLLN